MDEIGAEFAILQVAGYAIIFLVIAVPLFFLALYIGQRLKGGEDRKLKRGDQPVQFTGRGSGLTPGVDFELGTYKLQYRFPAGTLVKVELVNLTEGFTETLFIKSSSDAQAFTIDTPGRYAFQLEPLEEDVTWELEVSPLGLPSRPDFTEPL
jgi:hypothetical protein